MLHISGTRQLSDEFLHHTDTQNYTNTCTHKIRHTQLDTQTIRHAHQ